MPAGVPAADIDVDERTAAPGAAVPANAADQFRVLRLQLLGVGRQQLRVFPIRLTVVIQVVKPAVIVAVNNDVGRPAVNMRAVSAALDAPVVRWWPIPAEHQEPVKLEPPALHEVGE